MTEAPTCTYCGVTLPPPGTRGPARRYCSSRCRMAAHRGKSEKKIERWEPAVLTPVAPAPARDRRHRDLVAAVVRETAAPHLPVEAQVAEAVLEVKAIQARLERAADQTEGVLRARAYGLVEDLRSAVVRFVGGADGGQA